MKGIRNVTVFCSSSDHVGGEFFAAAEELGRAIAGAGWGLVYGGNRPGPMGRLAEAARAAGTRVIGITPQYFVDDGCCDELCDELIVTPDIRRRKELMEERGDAIIVLPGGIGTLEEFFEVLVARTLGISHKPLVLLNVAGYFAPLMAMIDDGVEKKFVRAKTRSLYFVSTCVPQAITYLQSCSQQTPQPI